MAARFEGTLSNPCLRDFAERCRRLAMWEPDVRLRALLLQRAREYELLAKRSKL